MCYVQHKEDDSRGTDEIQTGGWVLDAGRRIHYSYNPEVQSSSSGRLQLQHPGRPHGDHPHPWLSHVRPTSAHHPMPAASPEPQCLPYARIITGRSAITAPSSCLGQGSTGDQAWRPDGINAGNWTSSSGETGSSNDSSGRWSSNAAGNAAAHAISSAAAARLSNTDDVEAQQPLLLGHTYTASGHIG